MSKSYDRLKSVNNESLYIIRTLAYIRGDTTIS
jgi:hypothetical protein